MSTFIVNGQQVRATESNGQLGFHMTTKEKTNQTGHARPVVGFLNGQRIRAGDRVFYPLADCMRVDAATDDVPHDRAQIETAAGIYLAPSWLEILS